MLRKVLSNEIRFPTAWAFWLALLWLWPASAQEPPAAPQPEAPPATSTPQESYPQQPPQQAYPQDQPYPQQQQPTPPQQAPPQQYPQQQYPQQYPQQPYPAQRPYEPPPPPQPKPEPKGGIPDFSVRVDPLKWLLQGRLPFEIEVEVYKFITVQVVPIAVTSSRVGLLNMTTPPPNLRQASNGIGIVAGASIGAGFWLQGKPLKGYVLRGEFTNYSYSYRTTENGVTIDSANFVERRLMFRFGSYSRIGAFIIGGTLGIGAELNPKRRCYDEEGERHKRCNAFELRTSSAPTAPTPYSVKATIGSAVLDLFSISLGVAF